MKNLIKVFGGISVIENIGWEFIIKHIHVILKDPSKILFAKEYRWRFNTSDLLIAFAPNDNTVPVLYLNDMRKGYAGFILNGCSEKFVLKHLNFVDPNNILLRGRSRSFKRSVTQYAKTKL